ncbi:MAG: bifunctional diaminohydroxyphosphoribosylaminopyrimidine deaminase/5-amino-6-(5-phosphoribosylamino)uracil reductase RibD, partial [Gammaproteobacteria bacterium]|nr:bifunctional diaminohydroxyphosphoribosylaminopyrimidine deaminase/5-amino-6-(5-phosphoribosylamino)uracil reductase RibD [Gammaproteobacteria bacterium]
MSSTDDYVYMTRALALAERGLYTTDPNPRVGCVLVRGGRIVGEGWHRRAGEPHAEVLALRQAGEHARGATAYVTLEPCCHHGRTPPCSDALIHAGVARVVAAMEDPNSRVAGKGLQQLAQAGIEVACGLLAAQAEALNPGFYMRMRHGRPFVRGKLAMSLDGRTAMADGASRWITGEAARRDVQRLRARSSAVLTGIGTVLADDPALSVRLEQSAGAAPDLRQPLRVVLDTHLRLPETARVLQGPGRALIVTAVERAAARERLARAGAEIASAPVNEGAVDLAAVMSLLARREVNEVLLEAGARLSGAMLRAGLIDELVIYMAPHLMGDRARGLFHLPGLERMDQRIGLEIVDVRAVGEDWRITARV